MLDRFKYRFAEHKGDTIRVASGLGLVALAIVAYKYGVSLEHTGWITHTTNPVYDPTYGYGYNPNAQHGTIIDYTVAPAIAKITGGALGLTGLSIPTIPIAYRRIKGF